MEEYQFQLPHDFVQGYSDIEPPFGFNGLGKATYLRSYSRLKPDGTNERWFETVERVVNGTYTMMHVAASKNPKSVWIEDKATKSAKKMFDKIFRMKFLPPGRGLYAMGTKITENLKLYASLNNCGFVSTKVLHEDKKERTRPFEFLMLMSMMGVGVGFDVKGKGAFPIFNPNEKEKLPIVHVVEDSREGWVDSTVLLLATYFYKDHTPISFDYSSIRPKGIPLKTFGGVAPGPYPLEKLHKKLRIVLDANIGQDIGTVLITDIMNLIGMCVVAGGVRRTAEIALGDKEDEEFVHLKDFGKGRDEWMWTSNNSVHVKRIAGEAEAIRYLLPLTIRTASNGEPGYFWLDNMQNYARMLPEDPFYRREPWAVGTNPCAGMPTMCRFDAGYRRSIYISLTHFLIRTNIRIIRTLLFG